MKGVPISSARKRYLLRAAMLRDKLTDKALARRFDTTVDAIQNILKKERAALYRSTPSVRGRQTDLGEPLQHVAAGRDL